MEYTGADRSGQEIGRRKTVGENMYKKKDKLVRTGLLNFVSASPLQGKAMLREQLMVLQKRLALTTISKVNFEFTLRVTLVRMLIVCIVCARCCL